MRARTADDATLIERYTNGDESAFEALLNRHQTKVYGFILSKVLDQELADDLFQDTFIKVINLVKSGRYDEKGKFLAWVIRIAYNLTIDHFRKEQKMGKTRLDDPDSRVSDTAFDDIEEQRIHEQRMRDVQKLIATLPNAQRQVIVMHYYEGMRFKDIALETDVSINTALGRMRYGLIKLRKQLKAQGSYSIKD